MFKFRLCQNKRGGESKCFRINSDVRQGCIMSPCLFNVYKDTVMKVKMGMGREWILPSLL